MLYLTLIFFTSALHSWKTSIINYQLSASLDEI